MRHFELLSGLCLGILGMAAVPTLCATPARAQISQAAPAAGSAASAPISRLYDLLTQVEHSQGSFAQRAQLLTPAIDQAFDLETVLRNSVGLRYRSIPEPQKQQLLQQFRAFTVARYVSNFAPGGTDRFTVDPTPRAAPVPGEQIVHSEIITGGGGSTAVDYVMHQSGGGWQIVDVLLNGNISQVAVQRADFGSSFSTGDATPLIESLRKKTQAFSES